MSTDKAQAIMESPPDSPKGSRLIPTYHTIEVKFYPNFDELVSFRQSWDDFMAEVNADLWLSFDWCRLWWKYYGRGRKLGIFLFYHDGELIAILPLIFDHLKIWPLNLRVLKLVGTDFTMMTIGLPIKTEMISEVIERLAIELESRFRWDILLLGPISGRTELTKGVLDQFFVGLPDNHEIRLFQSGIQTYFQVEETWEKQLSKLKKKQRENLRRAVGSLQKMGRRISFEIAENSNLKLWFNEFAEMHRTYWVNYGQGGHFTDWPSSRLFHEEFAATQLHAGRLFLLKVSIDDQCVGYKYGYIFGDIFYTVLSARNMQGVGAEIDFNRLTFRELISLAQRRGLRWIDSMRGYYTHKIELGGIALPVKKIMIWPRQKTIRLKIAFFRFISFFMQMGYVKIWRRRVVPRLHLSPRPFSERYIRFSLFHE